jgi:spoIIIJ-associated protein
LVGRRGRTLDAIQHIAQRTAGLHGEGCVRVSVDAAGYRAQREDELRQVADDAAETALRSGREVELEAMPPAERRVVHEYLRDRDDVSTHSEGTEPARYLVVSPTAA